MIVLRAVLTASWAHYESLEFRASAGAMNIQVLEQASLHFAGTSGVCPHTASPPPAFQWSPQNNSMLPSQCLSLSLSSLSRPSTGNLSTPGATSGPYETAPLLDQERTSDQSPKSQFLSMSSSQFKCLQGLATQPAPPITRLIKTHFLSMFNALSPLYTTLTVSPPTLAALGPFKPSDSRTLLNLRTLPNLRSFASSSNLPQPTAFQLLTGATPGPYNIRRD